MPTLYPKHYQTPEQIVRLLANRGLRIHDTEEAARQLENACCHFARVWNKENAVVPVLPKRIARPWISPEIPRMRIFYNICILKWFVDIINPDNVFREQLKSLLNDYQMVDIHAMGFPSNWREEPLWR